jgi:hypothetical protein
MIKENRPTFLFLMETKSTKHRMEGLRVKLGFEGLFVVDPVGRNGSRFEAPGSHIRSWLGVEQFSLI